MIAYYALIIVSALLVIGLAADRGCTRGRFWWILLVGFNIPYRVLLAFGRPVRIVTHFFLSVFEVDTEWGVEDQEEVFCPWGAEKGEERDTKRAVHFAWHCVVYLPVVIIALMARLLGAADSQALFFVALASATVSLEICISIILDKVSHLEDLSRQTRRAYTSINDLEILKGWVEYFHRRHAIGRAGVAKAALVTTFSVVLFSSLVGVEALRMRAHSSVVHDIVAILENDCENLPLRAPEVDHDGGVQVDHDGGVQVDHEGGVQVDHEGNLDTIESRIAHSVHTIQGVDEYTMLNITLCLSGSLLVIAWGKLWTQTRGCLEEVDPMDRFETPSDALKSIGISSISHLVETSDSLRARENQEGGADHDIPPPHLDDSCAAGD